MPPRATPGADIPHAGTRATPKLTAPADFLGGLPQRQARGSFPGSSGAKILLDFFPAAGRNYRASMYG